MAQPMRTAEHAERDQRSVAQLCRSAREQPWLPALRGHEPEPNHHVAEAEHPAEPGPLGKPEVASHRARRDEQAEPRGEAHPTYGHRVALLDRYAHGVDVRLARPVG